MIDLLLRFADEAEWAAMAVEPDAALAVDVIGTLHDTPETESAEPIALPGFHVNIRCTDGRELSHLTPFIVTPEQPRRVWA